ncbi:MAG TPA: response regulator transcription factor, partial [Tepidiformaceae bacterium]|nr:response regulator transcription factor [Tepidiformaceae bacterium]
MIRLMLVDDHEIVRTGLRAMFELESDMEVAGEAGDGEGAVAAAERLKPDVVVMDIRMGGGIDGIDACRRLKSQRPETAVLMLTSFGTDEAVFAALMAGASGFLLKNTGRADLLRAVRLVAEGQS